MFTFYLFSNWIKKNVVRASVYQIHKYLYKKQPVILFAPVGEA